MWETCARPPGACHTPDTSGEADRAPGEVFEFAVVMRDKPVNTWRYQFDPGANGGTDATESFRLADNLFTKVWRPLGGFLRENRNKRDMLRTLERVKAVAEA